MKPGSKRRKAERSENSAEDSLKGKNARPGINEEAKTERRRKARKAPYSPQISSRSIFKIRNMCIGSPCSAPAEEGSLEEDASYEGSEEMSKAGH